MNEAPLISGEWRQAYERMLAYFETIPVQGERGLVFVREIGLSDLYLFIISQAGAQLEMSVTAWKKQHDQQRWQTETAFTPTLVVETVALSDEEAGDFAGYFDALSVESEENLLRKKGVLLLDGEQFRLKLFRNGTCFRSFAWDSATEAIGLMQRVIRMSVDKNFRK